MVGGLEGFPQVRPLPLFPNNKFGKRQMVSQHVIGINVSSPKVKLLLQHQFMTNSKSTILPFKENEMKITLLAQVSGRNFKVFFS